MKVKVKPFCLLLMKEKKVFYVLCYGLCSVFMTFLNRRLAKDKEGMFFFFFLQSLCTAILTQVLFLAKERVLIKGNFTSENIFQSFWLSLVVYTNQKVLDQLSIIEYTASKNLNTVFLAISEQFFYKKRLSKGKHLGVFVISIGALLFGDVLRSVSKKSILVGINVLVTVFYILSIKRKKTLKKESLFERNYSTSLILCCFFLLFSVILENSSAFLFILKERKSAVLTMCIGGLLINFSSFLCIEKTSATTYSVTGILSKVVVNLLNVLFFSLKPTSDQIKNNFIGMVGGLIYSFY